MRRSYHGASLVGGARHGVPRRLAPRWHAVPNRRRRIAGCACASPPPSMPCGCRRWCRSVWSRCSMMVAFPRIPPRARIAEPVETYPMDHGGSTTGSRPYKLYTSPCKTESSLALFGSLARVWRVKTEGGLASAWGCRVAVRCGGRSGFGCGRRTPVESGGGDGACLWAYLPLRGPWRRLWVGVGKLIAQEDANRFWGVLKALQAISAFFWYFGVRGALVRGGGRRRRAMFVSSLPSFCA